MASVIELNYNECVKCGHNKSYVNWMERSTTIDNIKYEEYLDYTCERCGYSWQTPTLDTKQDKD